MVHNSRILKELLFFGIVGVTTLLVDVGVTTCFYNLLHFPAYLASGVGFVSGFFFNFPMNRKKVFRHGANDRFKLQTQVVLYALLSVFNLLATSLLTQVMVSAHLAQIAYAKVIVTALIAVWNFIIFKMFIFSKTKGYDGGMDTRVLDDIL